MIRELQPDIVIDMICFRLDSAKHLVEALRGQVQHFLHCGTIWVHGPGVAVPTTEAEPRRPIGEYGIRQGGRSRPSFSMKHGGTASRRRSLIPGIWSGRAGRR